MEVMITKLYSEIKGFKDEKMFMQDKIDGLNINIQEL
jgi:hypothetical protein